MFLQKSTYAPIIAPIKIVWMSSDSWSPKNWGLSMVSAPLALWSEPRKIILGFLAYKLPNVNWSAKQNDFFKHIKKFFQKNHDLYCKIDVTPFDIEWNYSIKKAILCYNFLAGDVWRCL